MKLNSDDFELFGLARQFNLVMPAIDSRWRVLLAETHPDKFVGEGASAQRLAMQWSVRINEAHRRLKDPLARAAYLCELNGAPINAENNTAMPKAFLMQQMEWRESLDGASGVADIEALAVSVSMHREHALGELQSLIDDEKNYIAAAQHVRALMFVERFASDVDARLDALEN